MSDDAELLRRYAEDRTEEAFAELVRRHVNFVYSAALRQVNGDAHLAADVTQVVFTDLARKAGALAGHRVLAGWLFTGTRYTASKLIRAEQRRRRREQEAEIMNEPVGTTVSIEWERLSPLLDEALGQLSATDRDAVLLRYFEGRPFAEIGARLRLSENGARMRVERALEKLRWRLARHGLTSTAAALAAALAGHGVTAAPPALATMVTGAALAAGGATMASLVTFMTVTRIPAGVAGVIVLAGGAGLWVQAERRSALHEEIAGLREQTRSLSAVRSENEHLAEVNREAVSLRYDDAEFARLQREAAALQVAFGGGTDNGLSAKVAKASSPPGEDRSLKQLDAMPSPRFQARPVYPFELRRAGIGGEVVVDLVVDQEGQVRGVRARSSKLTMAGNDLEEGAATPDGTVITAAMRQEMEEAALVAVGKWRFTAGQKGGRAVNTSLSVPIVFEVAEGMPADAERRWF